MLGAGSLVGYCPWHSGTQLHIMASMEPAQWASTSPKGALSSPKRRSSASRSSAVKKAVGPVAPKKAFSRADADRSGTISRDELAQAL